MDIENERHVPSNIFADISAWQATFDLLKSGLVAFAYLTIPSDLLATAESEVKNIISRILGITPDPLVKTIRFTDPLVLDLNGDGLKTISLAQNILFDSNGDGIKTGTAWISPQDGLLVWDKNNNGAIDSGRELFGDETLLRTGYKALHGFMALDELDDGNAPGATSGYMDGVFDVRDIKYTTLRIWQDTNQDGIAQASELKTLAESQVSSINIRSTASNINYNDAILVQNSTFTRTDGSTGQAGSFVLAQNNFVRAFPPMEVTDAAALLPDLKGSGYVRDLREAATLNPDLIPLIDQLKTAHTHQEYETAVAALLREWGNGTEYQSASKQALAQGYGLILSRPVNDQERSWMDAAIKASESDRLIFRQSLSAQDQTSFDAMRERMVGGLEKTYAYEAFTGHTFLHWDRILSDANGGFTLGASGGNGRPVEVWVPLTEIINEHKIGNYFGETGYIWVTIPAPIDAIPHTEMLWKRLVDDASKNLLTTFRLNKYTSLINLAVNNSNIEFDFSAMNAKIDHEIAANTYEGVHVFVELYQELGQALASMGWNGSDRLREIMLSSSSNSAIRNALADAGLGINAAGTTTGTVGDDLFLGTSGNDVYNAKSGNDLIDGGAGNDDLNGDVGDDLIWGGDGNDILTGGDGQDIIEGGSGDDQLRGGSGHDVLKAGVGNDTLYGNSGNDTLEGGAGNDYLSGEAGNDTYVYGLGDGLDTIASDYDTAADKLNVLQFKAGVLADQVTARRDNSDLILRVHSSADEIRLTSFFYGNVAGNAYNPIQQVKFADGSSWDVATLASKIPVPRASLAEMPLSAKALDIGLVGIVQATQAADAFA